MKRHRVSVGTWAQRPDHHKLSWRDLDGKRKTAEFPKTRDGEADMRQFIAQIERDLNAGVSGPDLDMTFGQLSEKWMASTVKNVRPPTVKWYRSALEINLLPGWKDKPVVSIRKPQVTDKKLALQGKLSPGTVKGILGVIRSIFKFGTENEYVTHNPTDGSTKRLGIIEKSRRPLTQDEQGRFLKAAQEVAPAHLLHFLTLMETGVRLGELLALRDECVDVEARTITVMDQVYDDGSMVAPKSTKGRRTIMVSREFMDLVLATYSERRARGIISPWLLQPEFSMPPTKSQSLLARKNLHFAFKKVATRAGLPSGLSPHWLRHTRASDRLSHGESLAEVSGDLGHSRLSTTLNIYIEAMQKPESTAADEAAARRKQAMERADLDRKVKFAVRRVVAQAVAQASL